MTLSVTCRQRKTRGRTSALVSILASSATRCRFVDRFVRLNVSPVFPVNGSLRTAPRFPRSGPGKSGSPMSQVLLRCYDFPPRISGHLCFASGVHAILLASCFAACAPGRSEGTSGPSG